MRLQSLEIKGFKSFADKTVINFKDDVIGIVGPNGCGKSNVVDAIRWVLGEQKSTALRSDKMESVIFNGTKSRKASGVAEVSLTFENTKNVLPTDYTMVTISRVLYRSGESEYRLNGVSCRLKDIATLLIDTGMGSNSYAIIALGMVDDLLADRENSRRRLFEQAAGVSKYKSRKQETLTKLKGTEEDLTRVEDLLHEIDNQLKQLERQAKRAKKWVEIKQEYRTLSLELAVFKLADFKETYKSLKDNIQKQEVAMTELDANIAKAEAVLATEKAKNLEQERNLSDKQRELNSLVGRIRGMENDKKMVEQKIDFLRNKERDLQTQVASAQSRLTQLIEDIDYYRSELNAEKRIEATVEDNLVLAENNLKAIKEAAAKGKEELDGQLRTQQNIERQIVEIEKRRIAQQTNKQNFIRDIERATGDMQTRSAEMLTLKENRDALHKKQMQQQRYLEDLEDKEADRKEQLAAEERRLADAQQVLSNKNRAVDAKRNEFKLTKSLVENLEGFPESIRFLSKDKQWSQRVPLLSDVLYCQPEYRVAIENFLEPYLNYYIAPDLETANEAISKLATAQRGRANFMLPLAEKPENIAKNIKIKQSAINFVEFDIKHAFLFDFLLKNVYLVDDESEIEAFIAEFNPENDENYVVLTKNGAFSRGNRTVSGGSVGLFEGKRIGRKKNLEILEREINEIELEIKKINAEMETLRTAIDKLKKNNQEQIIRRERDELNVLQQQIVAMSTKLDNVQVFLTDLETRKTQAEQNIKILESQDGDSTQQLNDLLQQQQNLMNAVGNADAAYKQSAEQLSKASAFYNEKNVEFIRQQNKVAQLQRELNFREKQKNELNEQTDRNNSDLKNNAAAILQAQTDTDNYTKTLQERYAERDIYTKTLTNAEQNFFGSRSNIGTMEDDIKKQNRARQTQQTEILGLKDKFTDIKLQISSISERLRIEFSVEVNDLLNQEPNKEYNKDDLTSRTEALKKRLDTYGEVNPMAIEAYDEMAERHQFIVAQRDDLLTAKISLLDTISEIEKAATAQFMHCFDQTRENFVRVFRSLFTEDDFADLVLSDPENPLESKIDIIAKPKGKRPQTINQLSGGEKTLTATALLFSLYLLKPAPFCIFDEVDAPLDDANIDKFNKIIKEFSNNSQFIIVTHNKQTMAAVDVIYGVSMIEQGVSRVLPVDFRSLK